MSEDANQTIQSRLQEKVQSQKRQKEPPLTGHCATAGHPENRTWHPQHGHDCCFKRLLPVVLKGRYQTATYARRAAKIASFMVD
mmetsp:Transcript_3249/g.6906  ORF Transcript_3249/g.6906 Transcript_3249/m.6906 type:complete len:84 (-) Transcript_3249:31-282(-)